MHKRAEALGYPIFSGILIEQQKAKTLVFNYIPKFDPFKTLV